MACARLHLLLHLSALFMMSLTQIAGLEIVPNRYQKQRNRLFTLVVHELADASY